jgi:hypothetical protein
MLRSRVVLAVNAALLALGVADLVSSLVIDTDYEVPAASNENIGFLSAGIKLNYTNPSLYRKHRITMLKDWGKVKFNPAKQAKPDPNSIAIAGRNPSKNSAQPKDQREAILLPISAESEKIRAEETAVYPAHVFQQTKDSELEVQ